MNHNPEEPTIDTENVRRDVSQAISAGNLAQSTVAREAGISPAALSQFLGDRYQGNNAVVASKLMAWLSNLGHRASLPPRLMQRHDFVSTTAAKKIKSALTYAQIAPDFAVVIGEPGAGKTAALWAYQNEGTNVWIATMSPDTSGKVPMLEELGFAMGMELTGGAAAMRRQISAKVRRTGGLILIDEAQHLDAKAIETLRGIHDATEVGLVLCGNPKLLQTIARLDQVHSRMGRKVTVGKPAKADVAAVAGQFGVTDKDGVSFLAGLGRKPGGLRSVVKTLRLALMMSEENKITQETLTAAWTELAVEAST
jgi:DNA transposition AAA+ family ATPase